MYRSNSSRIFPMIIIILVVVALIAGLVTVGRYMFAGNSNQKDAEEQKVETAREQLLTITADRSVRITVRGPIVGDEKFRTERIQVGPSNRVYTIYGSYLKDVESQKAYENNTKAYEEFVYALDKAAFTAPSKAKNQEADDLRGICATGRVYDFEILDGSNTIERLWTSTCKGSPGTFGANLNQVVSLFTAQIPTETLLPPGRGSLSL